MDTLLTSPMPATPSVYLGSTWLEWLATFLLMFLFASFVLGAIKYFATKTTRQIIPNSTTNETMDVLSSRLPGWLWFTVQTVVIIIALLMVRGAFSMNFPNSFTGQESLLAMIEIGIAFGFLCLSVPKLGVKAAELISFNIIKNRIAGLKGGETVLTPDEYMEMGKIKNIKET
jgi:hypothetical protein